MKKTLTDSLLFSVILGVSSNVNATSYNYELSDIQTWSNTGSTLTTSQYVTVRAYVPGSNTINYSSVPIYTSTYSSNANSLGDVVGSVSNIYGTSPAWVDPFNGAKYSIMYPTYNVMRTRLTAVNDDRLSIGIFYQVGGSGKGFIYDLIHKQFTQLKTPGGASVSIADINNIGQLIGTQLSDYGTASYIYDCINGFQDFEIPGSTSTSPIRIDDQGNVYGLVYGIDEDMTYFIARPDSLTDTSSCSLVARDDVAEPIPFSDGTSFEMSGDVAQLVKVGDFNNGGADDIFVYHEMGKYILYLGEDGFKTKIKNFADWDTIEYITGVTSATEWDFNNDGLIDKVYGNLLYLAKDVEEYYYVPQTLPVGAKAAYGDFNGDGLMDVASFSDAFVSIALQTSQATVDPVIVDPEPVIVDPEPLVIEPVPVTSGDVPVIDANAEKVEMEDTIAEIRDNSILLSSAKILWFDSESIIKYNNASDFELGQRLEFKAWLNPDGSLIGIKVEIVD